MEFLWGSETVARIQRAFGVEAIYGESPKKKELHENGDGAPPHNDMNGNGRANGSLKLRSARNGVKNGIGDGISNGKKSSNGFAKEAATFTTTTVVGYKIHNWFWYYWFSAAAQLGNELFLILFFLICYWEVNPIVARRVVMAWAATLYIGQSLKDVIKWPRPSSPPVVKLEHLYEHEYGMPSTHAGMAVALPFTTLLIGWENYEQFPVLPALVVAFTWYVSVCFSRFYLGMHSVLDVIAGTLYSTLVLWVLYPWVGTVEEFVLHHQYSPAVSLIFLLSLAVCYPTLDRWSAARGDTTMILGVAAGAAMCSWINQQYFAPFEPAGPYLFHWPSLQVVGRTLVKLVVGAPILILVRLSVKGFMYRLVRLVLVIPESDAKATTEQVVVELPKKFATYFALTVCAGSFMPRVFSFLGLVV